MNEIYVADLLFHIGSFGFFIIGITLICLFMSVFEEDYNKRQ